MPADEPDPEQIYHDARLGPDLQAALDSLPPEFRAPLLKAAWKELRAIRRYLSLPSIAWHSFWRHNERGILRPYWRQSYRQAVHDGEAQVVQPSHGAIR